MSLSQEEEIFAVIPLKYTYLVKNSSANYLYASDTGLFKSINHNNNLIGSLLNGRQHSYQIIDNFNSVSNKIDATVGVSDSRGNENLLYFQISSDNEKIIKQKAELLAHYRKVDFKSLPIQISKYKSIFKANENNTLEFNSLFRTQLDELALFCNVEILISTNIETFHLDEPVSNEQPQPNSFYIYLLGDSDDTIFAETRLRILMDSYQGIFIDSIDIPLSLIPLVGGVEFGNFKAIAKQTGVNLYLPTILPELYDERHAKHNLDILFLSGLESQVLLSKKMLADLIEKTSKEIYYKTLPIFKFKKDSILINNKNELSSIMYKYGVFIQSPPLGHDDSTVHFQGVSDELVELAINDFITLTNNIYQTNFWFQDSNTSSTIRPTVSTQELENIITRLSIASNTAIIANLNTSSFELIANQNDSLKAINLFKNYSSQIYAENSFRTTIESNIELGLTYHEFISGKKNGKIVKIMNSFKSTEINFKPLNDYSLIITLKSTEFNEFLSSFSQLQQEFPSEFKFYIPESFHRQIIGSGGSLIQSIMRKYNVFVKFSNSYDLKNNLKSHSRHDNVIIRCPAKNASNIPLVRSELNSLLTNSENFTFLNTYCKVSRNQYRLLNFDTIQTIEKKTSTFIRFPTTEPSDFATVETLGLENHSVNATRLLINELAESYEFKISLSPNFKNVFSESNEAFLDRIKVPFKILYNFEIMVVENKSVEVGPYHSIILSYLPGSDLFLEEAIGHLTSFLREFEFMIIDRDQLSNNDLIINGSASRATTTSSNSSSGASTAFNSSQLSTFNPSSIGSLSTMAFSHSQQLYQLPQANQLDQSFSVSQPSGVINSSIQNQNTAAAQKKRPVTHGGYETLNFNNSNSASNVPLQRRPY